MNLLKFNDDKMSQIISRNRLNHYLRPSEAIANVEIMRLCDFVENLFRLTSIHKIMGIHINQF